MSSSQLRARIATMRADARAVADLLATEAPQMSPDELFEVAGDLQGLLNATEGAQLVATAHAAAHETRLTDRGPVHVHHGLGFVDAMAPSEVSLATGTGQWAAGRKVSLAAALAERFPRLLSKVLDGDVGAGTARKVVSVCDGLDADACAAVEAVVADRLPDLDPGRVTSVTRRVATRVAADQVHAAHRRNTRDRCVQVSPGPDGTTTWWAQLPAAASAAAWSAVTMLATTYSAQDPALTPDQARADAFLDLVLSNVDVRATVMIGLPVITNPATRLEGTSTSVVPDGTPPDAGTGEGAPTSGAFSISAALSGCELPGIGWIDADTVETLLSTVPLDVGRALLDARTGTLLETTSTAYRPPRAMSDFVATRDRTCRMWGCDRPATTCDVDHVRPWPAGQTNPRNLARLCRRHHRLKQRRRWSYCIAPDGAVTWTSPSGKQRTTLPDHAVWPPPEASQACAPTPAPTRGRELTTVAAPPF